jgi:hypothetical protein
VLILTFLAQAGARLLDTSYPGDLLFPDLELLAVGSLLLWLIRNRLHSMVLRDHRIAEAMAQQRRANLQSRAVRHAGARRLQQATRAARDMLQSLASGDADPNDPELRAWCTDEARYLRSVCRLGSHLAAPDVGLLALLTQARRAGIDITTTVDNRVRLPHGAQRDVLLEIVNLIRLNLAAIGPCSLSLLRNGDEDALVLVASSTEWAGPGSLLSAARESGLQTAWSVDAAGFTLEVTWGCSGDAAPLQPSTARETGTARVDS